MHLKIWNFQGMRFGGFQGCVRYKENPDALRSYIDTQSPKVWLHGHTYPTEENIQQTHGSTRIEDVYGYKVLSI